MRGATLRPRPGAALAGAAAALVAFLALVMPAVAGAAPWTAAAALGVGSDTQVAAISCAGGSTCGGIEGGDLVRSMDGGLVWTNVAVPADVATLDAIACPTATVCYAAGTVSGAPGVVVVSSGQVSTVALSGLSGPPEIACLASGSCVATDGRTVLSTTNGFHSLTSAKLPLALSPPERTDAFGATTPITLTCVAGSQECFAAGVDPSGVGAVEKTTDGGVTWTSQEQVALGDGVTGLACASAEVCTAVGLDAIVRAAAIRTVNGGTTWTAETIPDAAADPVAVGCPSTTTCVATALLDGATPVSFTTTDGGTVWAQHAVGGLSRVPTQNGYPIACVSARDCAGLVGGKAFLTFNSGTTWLAVTAPAAPGLPEGLACATATACVGVENDDGASADPQVIRSSTGGTSWSAVPLSIGTVQMTGVSCPSATVCQAVGIAGSVFGDDARMLSSRDGGLTWQTDAVAGAGGEANGVSCPSSTTCVAFGLSTRLTPALWATTNGGASWQRLTAPAVSSTLLNVASCGTASSCVDFAWSGGASVAFATSNLGVSWTPDALPASVGQVTGVSCQGTFCAASEIGTGSSGILISSDGGTSWQFADLGVNPAATYEAVDCSSASSCAVTGLDGSSPYVLATTDAGASWVGSTLPGTYFPSAIGCSATACIASTQSGTVGQSLIDAGAL